MDGISGIFPIMPITPNGTMLPLEEQRTPGEIAVILETGGGSGAVSAEREDGEVSAGAGETGAAGNPGEGEGRVAAGAAGAALPEQPPAQVPPQTDGFAEAYTLSLGNTDDALAAWLNVTYDSTGRSGGQSRKTAAQEQPAGEPAARSGTFRPATPGGGTGVPEERAPTRTVRNTGASPEEGGGTGVPGSGRPVPPEQGAPAGTIRNTGVVREETGKAASGRTALPENPVGESTEAAAAGGEAPEDAGVSASQSPLSPFVQAEQAERQEIPASGRFRSAVPAGDAGQGEQEAARNAAVSGLPKLIAEEAAALSGWDPKFSLVPDCGMANLGKIRELPYSLYLFGGPDPAARRAPDGADGEEAPLSYRTRAGAVGKGYLKLSEAVGMASVLHSLYYGGGVFGEGIPRSGICLRYALRNGIIREDDFPDYDAFATRAETAYLLARSVPPSVLRPQNEIHSLPDVAEHDKYGASIFLLYRAGVLTGSDRFGSFHPDGLITHAEAAVLAGRIATPSDRKLLTLFPPDAR